MDSIYAWRNALMVTSLIKIKINAFEFFALEIVQIVPLVKLEPA
jgi:hypothetical protein